MRRLLLLSIICLLLVGVGLGLYFWLRGGVGKPEVSITGASFEEASPTTVTIDVEVAIDNPNPLGATLTSLHIDIYFNRDGEWTYLAKTDTGDITIRANGRTPITLPVVVEDLGAIQAVWQFLSAQGSIDIQFRVTACIKVGPISPCISGTMERTVQSPAPSTPTSLQSMVVSPASATIAAGQTQQFTATGSYSDGSTNDITAIAIWTSSNPLVATVGPGGLAVGISPGTVTITATVGTVQGSATLTVVIQRSPEPTGYLSCSFTWQYKGSEWDWDIEVPKALYDYYKERHRPPTEDYSVYVTDPYDDDFISSLVDGLKEAALEQGWSEYQTVNFAVSFVQSLPYTSDWVTTGYDEYPRYPIETLVDNGGDCEDTSILAAAILNSMGYGVVILCPSGHVAVGVLGGEGIYGSYYEHNGGKYFYLETTTEGWEIGEIPDEYKDESVYIYDIVPIPVLSHDWSATSSMWHVTLEVTVSNLGTACAYDVYVLAGFDAGNGMLWNSEESSLFDLGQGYSKTITLTLDEPQGKHTRLVVQVVDDGYAADESYSEWFDT
jgi:LEA14-like dessication related protein/predicted transglutaminase-like cysteine proteinase